jgi:hypothetical protein
VEQNPLLRHPAMSLLKKALLRESRQQLIALFLMLSGSIAIIVFSFEKSAILPAIGLIGLIISIQFLYRTVRTLYPNENKIIQILFTKPQSIVWIYSVKTERLPFGFQLSTATTLYFKFVDGDQLSVSVPGKDLKVISRFLNKLLPHATFGYSPDRAQWYHISPDMLRKETEK